MYTINMRDMEFYGYIGCFPEEKANGQPFIVSCELKFDDIVGAHTDNLTDTVNYAEVYELIKEEVTTSKCDLIEYLSETLCNKILDSYHEVFSVKITVSKPQAPIDGKFGSMIAEIENNRSKVFLSVGGNMGDMEETIRSAVKDLEGNKRITDVKVAGLYETEPVGYDDQPFFLNSVIELDTSMTPDELLDFIHVIENKYHRVRTIKNGPRTLDLDILLFGNRQIFTKDLIVPHPRMWERAFVLMPLSELMEISPELIPTDKSVVRLKDF